MAPPGERRDGRNDSAAVRSRLPPDRARAPGDAPRARLPRAPAGAYAAPVPDPSVAVIVPMLERDPGVVDGCLASLAAQDYAGEWSVVVADGGSAPAVAARLEAWRERIPGLTVLPNPYRRQSHGCNLMALATDADVLVRADAHSRYDPGFVSASVAALLRHDAPVGGPQRPDDEGLGRFGHAVGAAMGARWNLAARFRNATEEREADSVYLGAFRRDHFIDLDGYRSFPSGVAEDADFYYRWRRRHRRRPWVCPDIDVRYRPRTSVRRLVAQYFRYGRGKAEMLFANGALPSWRSWVALAAVLWLVVGTGLAATAVFGGAPAWLWTPLAVLFVLWVADLTLVAVETGDPLAAVAAGVTQVAYAAGLLFGLLRGPFGVRSAATLRDLRP